MRNWLIGLIVLVIAIVGGYAIFHKSKSNNNSSSTSSNSNTSTGRSSSNAPAVNNAVLTTKTSSSLGKYLTDPNGKALYTYRQDSNGVSNCTSSCLSLWPAYQDMGSTTGLPTNVSTIKRTDNSETQYTYKGKPLYFFTSDSNGQVTGNGVGGFQVATP